jgi:hypothetical protein
MPNLKTLQVLSMILKRDQLPWGSSQFHLSILMEFLSTPNSRTIISNLRTKLQYLNIFIEVAYSSQW